MSLSIDSGKLAEGDELVKKAQHACKKSFFKSRDDDTAAKLFEKAGITYKAGRAYDKAVEAYGEAATCIAREDDHYLAGKYLESGALVAAQQASSAAGDPTKAQKAAELYVRASHAYETSMRAVDKVAEMLEKAGKALETVDVDQSLQYYQQACTKYEQEDRSRFAVDTVRRTIAVALKNKRYPMALEVMKQLAEISQQDLKNKSAVHKANLSMIIVVLQIGDEVEARKMFDSFVGSSGLLPSDFATSDECRAAAQLLEAYEQRDQDALQKTVNASAVFNFLDNEVTRLARQSLRVPGAGTGAGGGQSRPAVPPVVAQSPLFANTALSSRPTTPSGSPLPAPAPSNATASARPSSATPALPETNLTSTPPAQISAPPAPFAGAADDEENDMC